MEGTLEDKYQGRSDSSLGSYVTALNESAPENEYATEFTKRYEEVDLESKSTFEKDLMECLAKATTSSLLSVDYEEFTSAGVKNAWIVGYKDGEVDTELSNNGRMIFLETIDNASGKTEFYLLTVYEDNDEIKYVLNDSNTNSNLMKAWFNIDTTKDSGVCKFSDSDEHGYIVYGFELPKSEMKKITGMEYIKVSEEEVDAIETVFNPVQELLFYYRTVYWSHIKDDYVVYPTPSTPSVGMTTEQLVDTDWGYPQSRSKTEYAGGVKERWVYDQEDAYVYITNGVVTSISYY
jgi:hypothetical protein